MKGSYVLLLELSEEREVTVGKLGTILFPAGSYAYVGSAMGGLESRIRRHIRSSKKLHWHIDYLLQQASITDIIVGENGAGTKNECAISRALAAAADHMPGFGCSDCACKSHLYFHSERDTLMTEAKRAFTEAGLNPQSWSDFQEATITARSES